MEHDPIEKDALRLALGSMAVLGLALACAVHEPAFLFVAAAAGLNELAVGASRRCLFMLAWLGDQAPGRPDPRERRARLLAGAIILASLVAGHEFSAWLYAGAVLMGLDYMQSSLTRLCVVQRLVGPGR